jgi:hypothetical protein
MPSAAQDWIVRTVDEMLRKRCRSCGVKWAFFAHPLADPSIDLESCEACGGALGPLSDHWSAQLDGDGSGEEYGEL